MSTGVYGYPVEDATHIALDEVRCFYDSEIGSKVCISYLLYNLHIPDDRTSLIEWFLWCGVIRINACMSESSVIVISKLRERIPSFVQRTHSRVFPSPRGSFNLNFMHGRA